MNSKKVRDMMVPISDYATIYEDASLHDAVMALEAAQDRYEDLQKSLGKHRYKHRALVVLDKNNRVIGKVSMGDFIKALEPRYGEMGDFKSIEKFGFSQNFIKSLVKSQGLWTKPLDNLCSKASTIKVKDFMYTPAEGEYVDEDATLDEGLHQLIMGHHQSLLVMKGEDKIVVGVLRLTDVFEKICDLIRAGKP